MGANAAALLVFAAVPPVLGMIARSAHPMLSNPDLALPTLLMESLPQSSARWSLAALFSAEVSSADVILFMLATSLSQDSIAGSSTRRPPMPKYSCRPWRGGGGWGPWHGLAMVAGSIVDALTVFYTLLTVSLFVPVMAGLYLRRAGHPGGAGVDRRRRRARDDSADHDGAVRPSPGSRPPSSASRPPASAVESWPCFV